MKDKLPIGICKVEILNKFEVEKQSQELGLINEDKEKYLLEHYKGMETNISTGERIFFEYNSEFKRMERFKLSLK
jgi:hypothetical protein